MDEHAQGKHYKRIITERLDLLTKAITAKSSPASFGSHLVERSFMDMTYMNEVLEAKGDGPYRIVQKLLATVVTEIGTCSTPEGSGDVLERFKDILIDMELPDIANKLPNPRDLISNQPPPKRARTEHQNVRDIVNSEKQRFQEIQESKCDCLGCVSYMTYHKKLVKLLDEPEQPDPEREEEAPVIRHEEDEAPSSPLKRTVVDCCMCPAQLCEGAGFSNHLCKHLEGKTCERPGPVHTPKQHEILRYVFEHIICKKELGMPKTGMKSEKFDNVKIGANQVDVYGTCGRDSTEKLLGQLAKTPQRKASWTLEAVNRQLHKDL